MDWMALIGNYVFPVVACVAMGWFIRYLFDMYRKECEAFRQDVKEMRKDHEIETQTLKEALNNNTIALTRLIDKVGESDE